MRGIVSALEPYAHDRIYGLLAVVASGARTIVSESADRYIGWLRDEIRDPDESIPEE